MNWLDMRCGKFNPSEGASEMIQLMEGTLDAAGKCSGSLWKCSYFDEAQIFLFNWELQYWCLHGSRSYICNIFPILQTSGLINNFHQLNQNFIHKPGKFFVEKRLQWKLNWEGKVCFLNIFFDLMISVWGFFILRGLRDFPLLSQWVLLKIVKSVIPFV